MKLISQILNRAAARFGRAERTRYPTRPLETKHFAIFRFRKKPYPDPLFLVSI